MDLSNNFEIIREAPKVFVIGASTLQHEGINRYLDYRGVKWNRKIGLENPQVETIVEASGRVCYQAWDNKTGKTTSEYIQSSIVEHAHGSVLEHVWLNLMVADLPRSTQLELVRHGDGTAFSFESTRFTDAYPRFIIPPQIRKSNAAVELWYESVRTSFDVYRKLLEEIDASGDTATIRRKRKKEAARAVLPNCQGSDGVVSMNARSLRWITELRTDPSADMSIREFVEQVFYAALPYFSAILGDATVRRINDREPCTISFITKKV